MGPINEEVMKKALKKYGISRQLNKSIEECAEAITAVSKYLNIDCDTTISERVKLRAGIIDEIADVEIMMRCLRMIFTCDSEVDDRIEFKIDRLNSRIEAA